MGCDKNDWKLNIPFGHLTLEVEAAHPWHPNIEHKTGRRVGPLAVQEFLRRPERLHLQSDRLKEVLERIADGLIVIDDEDDRILVSRRWQRFRS